MSCEECYGCVICHNHKVIDKTVKNGKVDTKPAEEKPADFSVKKSLTGKLIGVRNEIKTLD